MIWGKTIAQKREAKRHDGDEAVRFIWLPNQLADGRWVWLEFVNCVWEDLNHRSGPDWALKTVVENPPVRY